MSDIPTRYLGFYSGFTPSDSLTYRVAASVGHRLCRARRRQTPVLTVLGPYSSHSMEAKALLRGAALKLGLPGGQDRRRALTANVSRLRGPIVWETAENVRVPLGPWDLSLSYDFDTYGGTNLYCPYWLFATDAFGCSSFDRFGARISLSGLCETRQIEALPPDFCAAFIRNPEPVRMRAVKELGEFGQVDVYGLESGRPLKHKAEIAGRYKFVLAFENSVSPGYITEKLVEAYSCGAVPLWNGPTEGSQYFDRSAFVWRTPIMALDEFAARVGELANDEKAWSEKASRPLLKSSPNLAAIRRALLKVLDSIG